MKIEGKVTYVDVEGGFWGIIGSDGEKFRPENGLPSNAQKEGLKISAEIEYGSGFSVFMWGSNVKIKNLKLLDS